VRNLTLAILLLVAAAVAADGYQCTSTTATSPDGKMQQCTTCCLGNSCSTTCV